jgi:hypothetical protein
VVSPYGRTALFCAVISILAFAVSSVVAAFTVTAGFEETFGGSDEGLLPPTLFMLEFHGFIRSQPLGFGLANLAVIFLLVLKEYRVSPWLATRINIVAATGSALLVLLFVFGLPVALYLPIFRIGTPMQ